MRPGEWEGCSQAAPLFSPGSLQGAPQPPLSALSTTVFARHIYDNLHIEVTSDILVGNIFRDPLTYEYLLVLFYVILATNCRGYYIPICFI